MKARAAVLLVALGSVACRERTPDPSPPPAANIAPPSVEGQGADIIPPSLEGQGAAEGHGAASGRSAPEPVSGITESTWHYDRGPFGPTDVVVLLPSNRAPQERFPVLVAFHGRGESLKGPSRGARGWVDDYELGTTIMRLRQPPLVASDLVGFVTDDHLAVMNRELRGHPYRGLIVVCPYLPDILKGSSAFGEGKRLAAFVVDELLPRAYRELPALGTPASTGVDGVSLGGRASLLVGLDRPEAFGAVGALQPALDDEEAERFAELAKSARQKNPGQRLRLLTSNGDYFLESVQELHRALDSRGVAHQLDVVVGPHSYDFNRGPGGFEMLLFHDAALR
jgi:enterochelin esterase-like enzyme